MDNKQFAKLMGFMTIAAIVVINWRPIWQATVQTITLIVGWGD